MKFNLALTFCTSRNASNIPAIDKWSRLLILIIHKKCFMFYSRIDVFIIVIGNIVIKSMRRTTEGSHKNINDHRPTIPLVFYFYLMQNSHDKWLFECTWTLFWLDYFHATYGTKLMAIFSLKIVFKSHAIF